MTSSRTRTKYREQWIAQGLCTNCGSRPAQVNRLMCETCAEANRQLLKRRMEEARAKGFCLRCRKRPSVEGIQICQTCREESRKYYLRNNTRRKEQWDIVLDHYGRKCTCCGESNVLFLTVSHVNNDGAKHRKQIGERQIVKWMIENNFPDGLTIECYNCNMGRTRNKGVCPHKSDA